MAAKENLLRITALMYKKAGMTSAEFHHYWSTIHAPKMINLHTRYGVVDYRQYHTTPETKQFLAAAAKAMGKECLGCDGFAEIFVKDLGLYFQMSQDPEYLNEIVPDEDAFLDKTKMDFTIGYEFGVLQNQKPVIEHTRAY